MSYSTILYTHSNKMNTRCQKILAPFVITKLPHISCVLNTFFLPNEFLVAPGIHTNEGMEMTLLRDYHINPFFLVYSALFLA